jgi:hypothetical protein
VCLQFISHASVSAQQKSTTKQLPPKISLMTLVRVGVLLDLLGYGFEQLVE